MADQSNWTPMSGSTGGPPGRDHEGLGGVPRSPRSQALARGLSRRTVLQNAALAAVATPTLAAFLAGLLQGRRRAARQRPRPP